MQEPISLVETLAANNYYLMTNEEGNEVYDDEGNLLLYQDEGGSCLSVPNTEEVRRLYDLPLTAPDKRDTVKMEDVSRPGSLVRIQSDAEQVVWIGQKSEHSIKATKMLIELFDSEKYQKLMKHPNTVKLKVWEKIAEELQANGFKIASNPREAGLRTFQKWRNMERTYWKIMKMNPDECGEDKRRKKPYFFDDVHVVISKRGKGSSLPEPNSLYNDGGNYKPEIDEEDEDDDFTQRPAEGGLKRKRMSDLYSTESEAFPRQALSLLASLVTSPKYDESLKDPSLPSKTKIWENICMDMTRGGWRFGSNLREGAVILSEKWRMVEKTILRKKLCGPRTLYTPLFRKAVLVEVEKRKDPIYYTSEIQATEYITSSNRRLKNGEIEPEAIEALLKLVGSGHYQSLFSTSGGKRAKIWEQIYEEIQSQGFEIAGASNREKVTRLFQKWRNMKRSFVKYLIAKFKGVEAKKPAFYELLFNIISKDVLDKSIDCEDDSDEGERMGEWDDDSDCEDPTDYLECTQGDHDYGQPSDVKDVAEIKQLQLPGHMDVECKQSREHLSKPSSSRPSRSHHVLKQIKSLHETSLAMQQQNFSKIISLLENQISEQNRLTTVISEYIMSQTSKSASKNGQRTDNFKSNNGNNEKRNTFKDESFLS